MRFNAITRRLTVLGLTALLLLLAGLVPAPRAALAAPAVSVPDASGPAGTLSVKVSGSGWPTGHSIAIYWPDGRLVGSTIGTIGVVDGAGNFYTAFSIPEDVTPGTYTVTFQDTTTPSLTARADFTVTIQDMSIQPIFGQVGTTILAVGSGWAGEKDIEVYWDGNDFLDSAYSDTAGNVTIFFAVPSNAALGQHQIQFMFTNGSFAIEIWRTFTVIAANPGGTGRVVFESKRDGQAEVYAMSPDGSGQARLTNNPLHGADPVWSPDGSKVAFSSDRSGNGEIYVMNADGTGQTDISNNAAADFSPAWSPDGTRIAFVSNRDGNNEIYVMNANGSGQTRLTQNTVDEGVPAWSPDSSKIVFHSSRDGYYELYVMNANGTGQTRLTYDFSYDQLPAWSPDGGKIAFMAYRNSHQQIYEINADGTGEVNVSNNAADDWGAAWSADGSQIAFVSDRDGNWEIYRMNADGSAQTRLTDNSAEDINPNWSAKPAAATFVLSGNVYVDANKNGARDAGESAYPNASVSLSGPTATNATTDANGNYRFADLRPGSYAVRLSVPAGYQATTANPVNVSLTDSTSVNFGIARQSSPAPMSKIFLPLAFGRSIISQWQSPQNGFYVQGDHATLSASVSVGANQVTGVTFTASWDNQTNIPICDAGLSGGKWVCQWSMIYNHSYVRNGSVTFGYIVTTANQHIINPDGTRSGTIVYERTNNNPIYAGYDATSQDGSLAYNTVVAKWTVPAAHCGFGENSRSAIWAGIQGQAQGQSQLAQIVSLSNCTFGKAAYEARWEVIPFNVPSQLINKDITAGDKLVGTVAYDRVNNKFNLTLVNSGKWTFTVTTSAFKEPSGRIRGECIVEAPMQGSGISRFIWPLTNFGSVSLDCTVDGKPIANGPENIKFVMVSNVEKAAPNPFETNGEVFTVVWKHS